jgi:hypothetical protein
VLLPPEGEEERREIAIRSQEPLDGRMASRAKGDQPSGSVDSGPAMMDNRGGSSAGAALPAVPLQYLYPNASELAASAVIVVVAEPAETPGHRRSASTIPTEHPALPEKSDLGVRRLTRFWVVFHPEALPARGIARGRLLSVTIGE